ncbi:MAG: M23 family metallopeptidase, partial [Burkholderiales bacterium]
VKEGQAVAQGQKIAEMGDSDSGRVALHFEIRRLGKPIDPLKHLPEKAS